MAQLATDLLGGYTTAEGGLTYSTTVYPGSTGLESRNHAWETGRHAWTVTWIGHPIDLVALFDLFEEAKGMLYSFRWQPPGYAEMDFRFDSDQLRVSHQAGGDDETGVILTVSVQLIQVLSE